MVQINEHLLCVSFIFPSFQSPRVAVNVGSTIQKKNILVVSESHKFNAKGFRNIYTFRGKKIYRICSDPLHYIFWIFLHTFYNNNIIINKIMTYMKSLI